jgi:hypothetical protein
VLAENKYINRVIAAYKALPEAATPVFVGILAFFGITGGRQLWPRNIAWLSDADAQTYFLGWHFYRFSPWGFPLGVSPRYGAELSSSIAFVDNVALFAIPFKAISGWLPDPFQYFGIWMLCCFVLQAWFAWLLVGLITRATFPRTCGTALFVLAPPFLFRLEGHYQMMGQWLLLAALYICFGPRRLSRGWAWPVLALTISLVHSYMTAMVLGLWATDMLRRVLFERRTRAELIQLLTVPGAVALGFWQAGLFMVGKGIVAQGFGIFRMNLTSLFDPSGWSYFMKDFAQGRGDYEGFNYLGVGGLLLVAAALPALKRALPALRERRRYWPLLALLLGLSLFAISNNIGLASYNFTIPLSQEWLDRANVLRGCGRMFWPVFYVIVWILVRTLFRQYRPQHASWILFAAVLLQAADTSAGWLPIRRSMQPVGSTWPSPLKSKFWADVPSTYKEIRMVPPSNREKNYEVFAYFAGTHGMATDAFYAARMDHQKLRQATRDAHNAVNKGKYTPGALYVLEKRHEKAARRGLHDGDFLGWVDGFLILAPNWGCRAACLPAPQSAISDCSAECADH